MTNSKEYILYDFIYIKFKTSNLIYEINDRDVLCREGEGSDGEVFWDVVNALLFLELSGCYRDVFIL